jgi:predicted GH43/DUF377 family glycosyl hydrolase
MKLWKRLLFILILFSVPLSNLSFGTSTKLPETNGGWIKYENNPVLGGKLGTCFDVSVLPEQGAYKMYFSWRPKRSIALVESKDGIQWSEPKIILSPGTSGWEERVNRPVVIKKGDSYHMWYTGQTRKQSFIGYATSKDGIQFTRVSEKPVLAPEQSWEKVAVMCPHVIWDAGNKVFRMWYSAGDQYEPNSIGYATSKDGRHWQKYSANPVFKPSETAAWEKHKVTACQVTPHGDWFLMFYIGFADEHTAHIGIARSPDGISNWQRHPANPIIAPGNSTWDADACYKPYAVFDKEKNRWLLWYNGRRNQSEQIGLAFHKDQDLGWQETSQGKPAQGPLALNTKALKNYIDRFNQQDEELYVQQVPNAAAYDFLKENIPLLDCPDKQLEEIYYFRWWTYRKHIKKTPVGFVITEFLPNVGWSGKYNTISCPAGHHFYEGRWLHDPKYLNEYSVFWFRKGGEPRRYSFWAADAIYARHQVHPNQKLLVDLLNDLVANYQAWEKSRLDQNGLFWQIDDRDGMEVSIGGSGYRATINSYMYADALAIARIARLADKDALAKEYLDKAERIKNLVQTKLWNPQAKFFQVMPRDKDRPEGKTLADVRELHGYTPWYCNLPDPGYEAAWQHLMDPQGFYAPYGPTTAEQRHPKFSVSYKGHECQWNGPSWPYATSVTLTALANLLNQYRQSYVDKQDYFDLLKIYTQCHRLKRANGSVVPWIDENLNPHTGDWISRTRLKSWRNGTWDKGKGGKERGKDYNHSTFCDLVITGLIGLRPRDDDTIEVNPLLPQDQWDYFCLDNLRYHDRTLTILWDKTGKRYNRGKGLRLFADGREIAAAKNISKLTAP